MRKIIKEEREYRIIETDNIKSIRLATINNIYVIDISFGDYGVYIGRFEDEVKAKEILEEIKDFINNHELEEYSVEK